MAIRIILDIDVTNPEDVIKNQKGRFLGLFSGLVLSKDSRRRKVNQSLADKIVETIHQELPKALDKEMVKANYKIKVIPD